MVIDIKNKPIAHIGTKDYLRGTTRNSPKGALSVQIHLRSVTESPGKPYCYFRQQLMGEGLLLHASGFHHPALSITVMSANDDPIYAFEYLFES